MIRRNRGTCQGIPRNRVQIGVAEILPYIAMNLIGAGFYAGTHHSASRMSKLGTEVAGLQAKFRQRIGRRPDDVAGAIKEINEVGIVIDAVENEVVLFCPLPIGHKVTSPAAACIAEWRSYASR